MFIFSLLLPTNLPLAFVPSKMCKQEILTSQTSRRLATGKTSNFFISENQAGVTPKIY